MSNITISGTFDVRSINLDNTNDGLNISSTFVEETKAKGVLYVFWNKGQSSYEKNQPLLYPVKKNEAEAGFTFSNFPFNYNAISANDIEFDNKIHSGLPASETDIDTNISENRKTAGNIGDMN